MMAITRVSSCGYSAEFAPAGDADQNCYSGGKLMDKMKEMESNSGHVISENQNIKMSLCHVCQMLR